MARAASSTADAEGHNKEAGTMKSSTAVAGAPFGDFTPDEEKRFLASADGDKVEAMRRYKAALVRTSHQIPRCERHVFRADSARWRNVVSMTRRYPSHSHV